MSKTDIAAAEKANTNLAVVDYGEDAGAGFDNVGSEDVSIPFFILLQALSPQLEVNKELRPGMLYNPILDESYDPAKGVLLVPCYTDHVFVEWIPKDKGGGMVGTYGLDSDIVKKAKESTWERKNGGIVLPNGNELTETWYLYALQCDEDGSIVSPVVLSFTSTKIKKYRAWMSRIQMFAHAKHGIKAKPPLFAHLTRITALSEKNKKNQPYYNFSLAPANGDVMGSLLPPNDDRLFTAKNMIEMIRSGRAKVDASTNDRAADADSSAEGSPDPDKAPF